MDFSMREKAETGVIALITDFGTSDYYVGAIKGVILSINENANIVDISHEIEPQNIASASYALRACYENFPPKTIFVAIVDPGVGSARRAILVKQNDYFFVAPDNGLLSFVFNAAKDILTVELTNEEFFLSEISRTFHGRDVFAPVAAHLSNGIDPKRFGAAIKDYVCIPENKPRVLSENEIEGAIINIDRFGNIVTNFTKEDAKDAFFLKINGRIIDTQCEHYSQAADSEVFMIWGSAGYLEISAFQASAAKILKTRIGQTMKLHNASEKNRQTCQ